MTTNSPNSIALVWRLNRNSEGTPQGVFNRNLDSIHVRLEVIDELNSMAYYTDDRKLCVLHESKHFPRSKLTIPSKTSAIWPRPGVRLLTRYPQTLNSTASPIPFPPTLSGPTTHSQT